MHSAAVLAALQTREIQTSVVWMKYWISANNIKLKSNVTFISTFSHAFYGGKSKISWSSLQKCHWLWYLCGCSHLGKVIKSVYINKEGIFLLCSSVLIQCWQMYSTYFHAVLYLVILCSICSQELYAFRYAMQKRKENMKVGKKTFF